MDLTQFGMDKFEAGAESSGGEQARVKPGRYNLKYSGSDMVEGRNGWKALKILFDVEGEIISVNHAFTMAHNNEKPVEIGRQSLSLMLNAMGVGSMKNTDELLGKKVEAELIVGEKGYLEINDNFGKTWMAVGASANNLNPKEELPKEEMFPSGVDEEDDNLPF